MSEQNKNQEFLVDKDTVDEFMKTRGFTTCLWGMQGDKVSSVEYSYFDDDMGNDLSYICTVYFKDGRFEFFYVVPHSISQLRCSASPITNEKHFDRLNKTFKEQVECLYNKFSDFSYL